MSKSGLDVVVTGGVGASAEIFVGYAGLYLGLRLVAV